MQQQLLLGDEAVALGALDAGLSGAFSYPGTPATEILEYLLRKHEPDRSPAAGGLYCAWSANEKVAYEEALGMSYAGLRALVSFKHVGLNVAADPFVNSAVTGIDGGLMVVSADDPGMHSSQNEQDSRAYASFALLPCLEPGDAQEAYEMAREAYDLSERFALPVMMRLVTRLAHSRSGVTPTPARQRNAIKAGDTSGHWALLPSIARAQYSKLVEKYEALRGWSEGSRFNRLQLEGSGRVGVIAAGIAYGYFLENYADGALPPPHLKLGTYPIPTALVEKLLESVDEVLVLEDGYPVIESGLRGLLDGPRGKRIRGRLDGTVPRCGELTPDLVRAALGLPGRPHRARPTLALPGRPPSLCDGCPHIDSYKLVRALLDEQPSARVFADIGCYTLAALPPYECVHTCVEMGGSIGLAAGAAAAGMHPVLATIGDSTFIHSGMTPLVGAAKRDLNMTVFLLDNATTAMTGGQESLIGGEQLEAIVKGLGVKAEHVHRIVPHRKHHEENLALVRKAVAHRGLSVVIAVRECIQTAKR